MIKLTILIQYGGFVHNKSNTFLFETPIKST